MFNKSSIFQSSIVDAHNAHTLVNKKQVGDNTLDAWTTLSAILVDNLYTIWSDSHDNAGRTLKVIDTNAINAHYTAANDTLKKIVEIVGEVSFSDDKSALLSVDRDLVNNLIPFAVQEIWKYSDEANAIIDQLSDVTYDRKQAEKEYARYNFAGVNPEALAAKGAKVEELIQREEGLKKMKKDAIAKDGGKVREFAPTDENKFRASLEHAIYDMIMDQKAMTYAAYVAKKEEQRKARREKTKARNAAKKAAKAQEANK